MASGPHRYAAGRSRSSSDGRAQTEWRGDRELRPDLSSLGGRLDLYGEGSFRSKAEVDLDAPIREIDGRTVVNAHVGYTPTGTQWTVGLWARNLANQDYMLSRGRDLFANQFVKHGEPRMFGADVKYSF